MSANNLAKSAKDKDPNDNDFCKKHAQRSDKDNFRTICPSKLSKRELEDLYYSLLENNLELKRTINAQNEKNRILSTKVQRMTAQTKMYVTKECCTAGKAVISEQKAAIADLTKGNEVLADRIRRLSTQLCTAKQFLKQNPNARHCYKCYVNTTTSVKNLSTTSLQNKSSNVNLKSAAVSAVQLDQEPPSTRTAETNTTEDGAENEEKGDAEKVCNENRCRTTLDQFKQKIEDLESELAKTHTEYSIRMTELESKVSQLQRARNEKQGIKARDSLDITRTALRQANVDREEIESQLSMEKKKVAELEMRLKAAEISQRISQTVEGHLSSAYRLEEKQQRQGNVERCSVCSNIIPVQPVATATPSKTPNQLTVPDDRLSKSDDSGYADHRRDSHIEDKNINKTKLELMQRISEMQSQLDALKLVTTGKANAELETTSCARSFDQFYIKSDEDQETKDGNDFPKRTRQISILEPAVKPLKELDPEPLSTKESVRRKSRMQSDIIKVSEMNIPSKDFEQPCREKYDPDLDMNKSESTNYLKEQAGTSNATQDKCPNDNRGDIEKNKSYKSSELYDSKKNNLQLCSITPLSVDSLQQVVAGMKTKPANDNTREKPNDPNYNVSDETTSTKRKRVSLVIYENGPDIRQSSEIAARTPAGSKQKDPGSVTCPDQSNDPLKIKPSDLSSQVTPARQPLPAHSDSVERQQFALNGNNTNIGEDKIAEFKKTTTNEYLDGEIKMNQDQTNNFSKNVFIKEDKVFMKKVEGTDSYACEKSKEMVIEVENPEGYKSNVANDPLIPTRSQEKFNDYGTPVGVQTDRVSATDYKTAKDILKSEEYEIDRARQENINKINGILRINEFDICQHHATICTCIEKPSPSLTLFRSCSGSQTLATLPVGGRFRRCSCSERAVRYSCGSSLKDRPIGTSTPKVDRASAPAPPVPEPTAPESPRTYTVDSGKSRPDSPPNTENEISVMTDLPSEKDDTYDRLSPDDHRPTTQSAETCSLSKGLTLSEGEIPTYEIRYKSLGEVGGNGYDKQSTSYGEHKSPSENMEATLRVISQELARCRSLLLTHRPTEQQKDAASGPDRDSLLLRKTQAKSRIDGTTAPTCLFIMHVVSVVFSDEAVMRSHGARLTLSWQFSDYKTTMIPLETGRVVHFDFSTQHELLMTKEVIDYLKKEDLLIVISETDNAKNVFASCSLPLRQVLVNINRRVDLSLPLRPGPYLNEKVSSTVTISDDVGVFDLWCMLLCEQKPLTSSQILNQDLLVAGNPETLNTAEQPKETQAESGNLENEASQQKPETERQLSFQRQKFIVPNATAHNLHNPATSLEARQVGFEVPRGRDKEISLVPDYVKNTNVKKNSSCCNNYQQVRPSVPRTSKSRFSKVPDDQILEITILWLTLNENCESVLTKNRKLYVAYTFLGRDGAELETPVSLPKPEHYTDKCIYNFSKTFNLTEMDMRILEHMASCRSQNRSGHSSNDCIVFTVVSEPPEDPLGLDNCEDIGFAFLYLGDLLAYCSGNSFTEALPVRGARAPARACGVLAVRVDGLDVLRACRQRTT